MDDLRWVNRRTHPPTGGRKTSVGRNTSKNSIIPISTREASLRRNARRPFRSRARCWRTFAGGNATVPGSSFTCAVTAADNSGVPGPPPSRTRASRTAQSTTFATPPSRGPCRPAWIAGPLRDSSAYRWTSSSVSTDITTPGTCAGRWRPSNSEKARDPPPEAAPQTADPAPGGERASPEPTRERSTAIATRKCKSSPAPHSPRQRPQRVCCRTL